ncbi:hypothetical protein [Thiohalocapsa halophila]|uniref:hypothetical protein n=1 Tax=Thiohalocapsa halophila TaxID=69359 RepID=UPI0019072BE2|nr:hypothetical protein [Thiohalocapsa halophila]
MQDLGPLYDQDYTPLVRPLIQSPCRLHRNRAFHRRTQCLTGPDSDPDSDFDALDVGFRCADSIPGLDFPLKLVVCDDLALCRGVLPFLTLSSLEGYI